MLLDTDAKGELPCGIELSMARGLEKRGDRLREQLNHTGTSQLSSDFPNRCDCAPKEHRDCRNFRGSWSLVRRAFQASARPNPE